MALRVTESLSGCVGGNPLSLRWAAGAVLVVSMLTPPAVAGQEGATDQHFARQIGAAHAHNDYEHERPLLDALRHGFRSVEVDVHLRDGQLLVAHDLEDVEPTRTIESLYLDPLAALCAELNGSGPRSLRGPQPTLLLVDIKTQAEPTFDVLAATLSDYADMLTTFGPDSLIERCVSVVISGNRAKDRIATARPRLAAIDGRPEDLEFSGAPAIVTRDLLVDTALDSPDNSPHESPFDSLAMPLISESWLRLFTWTGDGRMPADEHALLVALASRVRVSGRELRFWATPDAPGPARTAVWDTLLSVGATLLNSDDLDGLAAYLESRRNRME